MAKVKDPFGAREARGSVGGITASRNTAGQILRCKASPVQPRSHPQTIIRAEMQQLTYAYQNLTSEQIILWNDFAANWPTTDVFGDSITLSGMNWFIALNARLKHLGKSINLTPPLSPNSAVAVTGSIFQNVSTHDIMLTLSATLPDDNYLFVKHSSELPKSSIFAKKSLKLRKTIEGPKAGPVTLYAGTDIHFTGDSLIQFEHFFVDDLGRATPAIRENWNT